MHPSSSTAGRLPSDRPLSPPSSPKGVSFPSARVCKYLDRLWASRAQRLPQRCDYYADQAQVQEPEILSAQDLTLGKFSVTDTSSSSTEADAVTDDTAEVSQTPSDHSAPPISARGFHLWQWRFFIRTDRGGLIHTYPSLDGPFRSLQEAEDAIARHLDEMRSPMMCTDGLSQSEICIRNILYWPDGTRKKSSKSCPHRRNISLLVHSLLGKYNEDHHLLGDLAYELEEVVSSGKIYEGIRSRNMFYHINFTTKTKGGDGFHSGDDNPFFAEVTCRKGENEEYVLNCLCMVKSNDKGRCYGCENNGSVDLRHPTNAREYKGGHSKPYPRCRGFDLPRELMGDFRAHDDEEARLAAEESRIRHIYKCLDGPVIVAKLDGATRAAPAGSSKREDGQGKALMKYVVPARRRQLG